MEGEGEWGIQEGRKEGREGGGRGEGGRGDRMSMEGGGRRKGGRGERGSQPASLIYTGRICSLLSHSVYMCIFLLLFYSLHTQDT